MKGDSFFSSLSTSNFTLQNSITVKFLIFSTFKGVDNKMELEKIFLNLESAYQKLEFVAFLVQR